MLTKEPDVKGVFGKAWKGSRPPADKLAEIPDWKAGLDLWLLHCPGAHPVWGWYIISGCSLGDIPGVPPAKKHRPDSTHEVICYAMDPAWTPDDGWCVDGEGRWAKHFLTPANLVEQTYDFTDDLANELLFLLVRAFCTGHANPDTDFRTTNTMLVRGTADHLRRGMHTPH